MTGNNYTKGFQALGIDLSNVVRNRTTCPKCSHQRKKSSERCLWLNFEHGNFYCHNSGCDFQGRADSDEWLVKKNFDLSEFKGKVKIRSEYKKPKDTFSDPNGVAKRFLNFRGISDSVIERNRIAETRKHYCVFRYYRNNELIRVKFRDIRANKNNTIQKWSSIADCAPCLYKLDDIKDQKFCIITEGEIDALSWEEAGIKQAVSLDAGATEAGKIAGMKFACVIDALPILQDIEKIYIALDQDEAGKHTALLLAKLLGTKKCYRISYPEDCKDSNAVLTKYGAQKLRECAKKATPFQSIETFFTNPDLKKVFDNSFDINQKCDIKPFMWVRDGVNDSPILAPGMIGAVLGHEKSGKTLAMSAIAASAINGGNWIINFKCDLGGKKVVWLDTEQGEFFFDKTQRRVYRLAGLNSNCNFYTAYHMRALSAKDRMLFLETVAYNTPDLGLMIVDGFVDLLPNYNDLDQVTVAVNKLMKITDELGIAILGILHLNKGDGKPRGHFGSELKNKAETLIYSKERENVYHISNPISRWQKFKGFSFTRNVDGLPEAIYPDIDFGTKPK